MRRSIHLVLILLTSATVACGGGGSSSDDPDDDDTPGDDADDDSGDGIDAGTGSADAAPGTPDAGTVDDEPFSFFVTSLDTMRLQSGSQDGFGGDLGGLAGADQICQTAAANVGFGGKTWRAFLSVVEGPGGGPVNAIERIGAGPWYDRNGRLIAEDTAGLIAGERPAGDAQTINDLPDETGMPLTELGDTHDIMTGSTARGVLDATSVIATCGDWTVASDAATYSEKVTVGHSWPAGSGRGWIKSHRMRGCAPGVNLRQNGPGTGNCVGCGGGWGAIYCFALTP
jgi:hypothetical protein